jgi:hypothetical protein
LVHPMYDREEDHWLKSADGPAQRYPWPPEHSSDQSRENDADEFPYPQCHDFIFTLAQIRRHPRI